MSPVPIPAWCGLEHAPSHPGPVQEALEASRTGPVALVGPAGAGSTAAGAAVMQALEQEEGIERLAFVRMCALTSASDVVLSIGRQVDARLAGDSTSVSEALAAQPSAVFLDDADLAPEAAAVAMALGSQVRWVLTGRRATVGQEIRVHGEAPDPQTLADAVPPGAEVLFDLPVGLSTYDAAVPPHLLRAVPERVVPRRAVSEALGCAPRPTGEALASGLFSDLGRVEAIACGLLTGDVDDLGLFRAASQDVADPNLACLAAAAGARIALQGCQPSEALGLIRRVTEARRSATYLARGALSWLEGDAFMAQGDGDGALKAHTVATVAFRSAARPDLVSLLSRHCAAAWSVRGGRRTARRWLAEARDSLGTPPDPVSLADILRISADVAAHAGEPVGAEALYSEAAATLGPHGEPDLLVAIRLGQAALEMNRGQMAAAVERLAEADRAGATHSATIAAIDFRKAEVALRRGHLDEARRHAERAAMRWRRSAAVRGLALTDRLFGDLCALGGDRNTATAHYDRALRLCVRSRDLVALRRLLRRMIVVEREGLPGPRVDDLREHLDVVEVLLQMDAQG